VQPLLWWLINCLWRKGVRKLALKREVKEKLLSDMRDKFSHAAAIILMDYANLKVSESDNIRRKLRAVGAELRVAKNTVMKMAASGTPAEVLIKHFIGPKILVIVHDDPVAASKVLLESIKDLESLKIVCGMLGGKYMDAAGVEALSKMPSREVMLAKLLSVLVAVPTGFVNVLAGVPRKLLYALKAIEEKKAQ